MPAIGPDDVDSATTAMLAVLLPHAEMDWHVPAGSLEWSCTTTAAHVAHDLAAYAGQVAAGRCESYLPFDLTTRADASPRDVLDVAATCGGLLSLAIAAASPLSRGWHWGPTDPTGFAALGVNEMLMHTYDITQGLKVAWRPPASLCTAVLARLFPDAPNGEPCAVLLWCTGRASLGARERRIGWVARAAVD